ncbi:hypothetical protein N8I77_010901 [Diaporthe amygdali]|uniref:Uncharacterized protein n=1 Tax=Phomopsis amygdali TaxID=1214568 RepID=A0AAD9VZW1_PHOAM|nr:hypothetical protein N8I77_010901 [Diaporthe amygdali]
MESLFYALGILLSGALIFHFLSQFSISIWVIYFIVGKMWPFMSAHQPWDPIGDKIDDAINNTIGDALDNLPSLCGDLVPRRKGGGGGGRGGRKGGRHRQHGLCEDDGWEGDPLAMTVISGFYAVMCLLLLLWCAYIFAKVVRLGGRRRQEGSAIRTVLHLTANRLATPAFAAVMFLGWYLVWGSWTWFAQCRPLTNMSYLNFANALMLTVPGAVFTVAWLVGMGGEIAWHVRSQRQDDIPLHNLGPPLGPNPLAHLFPDPAAPAAPGGEGGGVSTTLLLQSLVRCVLNFPVSLWVL